MKSLSVVALKRPKLIRCNSSTLHRFNGFALYEVLIGLTIFVIGVLALGRAVENCLNASTLSAEEDRVREILSNRMAEIQTAPGFPDVSKEFKVDTGYGIVKLTQKSAAAGLTEPDAGELSGIYLVTLTAQWGNTQSVVVHHVERTDDVMAQWTRESGSDKRQSKSIEFYVYRPG